MEKPQFKQSVMDNLPKANNEDVKDFNNFIGKETLASTPAEGLMKKQKFIEKSIDRKQNSIKDFAIKRDACMFAVAELGKYGDAIVIPNIEKTLKEFHEKWLLYFETIYGEQNND